MNIFRGMLINKCRYVVTYLFSNFSTVVKVIKSEDPLLAVVILHRNITLQILRIQTFKFLAIGWL